MLPTIETEDKYLIPFFTKQQVSIKRGKGVYVYDEQGKKYLDLTSGWGVTCIGHAHPVITRALTRQARKIIQNPNSGLTYSPARAGVCAALRSILPAGLSRVFFTNSGAEANDAAIKLARKATGRMNVISSTMSFHGRTISTASATGQDAHRSKFNPLMPNYLFVPFNDVQELAKIIDQDVAAVILEPIQGEGGVNIPSPTYLKEVSILCRRHGVYLIIDEIQTGFGRTGKMFACDQEGVKVDFLTMAKGIAGGFPFGAFAVTEEVSAKLEIGDHGGTYCGNPLGCAVSQAVIEYMIQVKLDKLAAASGEYLLGVLQSWIPKLPQRIREVRGQGLLIVIDFDSEETARQVYEQGLAAGLILNLKHGSLVRLFPALNITRREIDQALGLLYKVITAL